MLFTAEAAGYGREYWLSDGTPGGTTVLDINPGPGSGADPYVDNRMYQVAARGFIAFTADDGVHGRELWATDGTRAGTRLLKDIRPGAAGSIPFQFRAVGDRVYFSADDGEHGVELWTSDGTADGTGLVADIVPGGEDSSPQPSSTALGLLFFSARYRLPGSSTPPPLVFFRTDGTRNGTIRLGDWNAGPVTEFHGLGFFEFCSGCPDDRLAAMNGGLWATNGEPSGHVVIKSPLRLYSSTSVVARDRLLFSAFETTRGYELWSSDGTAQGTGLVLDVWPGPESSSPSALAAVGERVAFEASDGVRGAEPWLSDGTAAGTRLAADVRPGPNGSSPRAFTQWGGRVYFVSSGELWVLTATQ
jgi:ELWxxDGT repeat protein